jgi:hypothetical protein
MTNRKVIDQHATASQSFGVAMLPALCASANILLLSFARFRFDDRYTGLANISGYLHLPVLPNLSATRLYMVFGTSLSY